MRQILNRHPSIAVCRETHFMPLVHRRRKAFGDLSVSANRSRLISEYFQSRHIRRAKLDSAELAEKLMREGTSYQAMFASILRFYADSQGKRRTGEKTPQHALYLETLRQWFPGSVIIHMIRDPRATVASMLGMPWPLRSVFANARRWLTHNRAARRFRESPGYLEVRYEALVTDPENEVRKICAFLGEQYDPGMIVGDGMFNRQFDTTGRSTKAISSSSLDAWKTELTPAQVSQIEWVVGAELETFGYPRYAKSISAPAIVAGIAYAAFDWVRFTATRLPAIWYATAAQTKIARFEYWSGPAVFRKETNRS
jgi:hypothetical protein